MYSGGIICHSSVGQAVWSLVIPRASHTCLPGGWGIILCALIMGPHIWLYGGMCCPYVPLFP